MNVEAKKARVTAANYVETEATLCNLRSIFLLWRSNNQPPFFLQNCQNRLNILLGSDILVVLHLAIHHQEHYS
jgi:hypothetical protein